MTTKGDVREKVPTEFGAEALPVLAALNRMKVSWGTVKASTVVEESHDRSRLLSAWLRDSGEIAPMAADLRRELDADRRALALTGSVKVTVLAAGLGVLVSFLGIQATEAEELLAVKMGGLGLRCNVSAMKRERGR